jgi:hypothetical protein
MPSHENLKEIAFLTERDTIITIRGCVASPLPYLLFMPE